MKLLEIAMIELEDQHGNNPVLLDLFDFSAAQPLYEPSFNNEGQELPTNTETGASILLKSGGRIVVKQTTRQVYAIIQRAAIQIASSSSRGTASAPSAAGSGRMATQQAANAQEEESRHATQIEEKSSSENESGSQDTEKP